MKISEQAESAIEAKFKSKKMELQVVKYVLTVEPGVCAGLEPGWFSIQPLQDVIELCRELRVCLTRETLLYELRKAGKFKAGKSGEAGLQSVYEHYVTEAFKVSLNGVNSSSVRVLMRQLYELSESRTVLFSIKSIIKNIESFNINKVKDKFRALARNNYREQDDLEGDYLDDYEERLRQVQEKGERGDILIPTGVSKLDWQIGGIMPAEFGVVVGRTGLGKTAMLVNMALNAWLKDFNIAFATGEMRKVLIQYRMDSNLARIEGDKFRTGKFTMQDFERWAATIDGMRQMRESFLEVEAFPRNFNTDNLTDWLYRIQDKHSAPVHILFVDYLNIMEGVKSKKDRGEWQSQANAVWDLKTLSETFNGGGLPTWTAGQIKDEFYDVEQLTLEAPKYARAISETAPIVCGLVRTEDDILYNTMQLQILKMRNASPPKRAILLHPDLNFMRINDRTKARVKSLFDLEYEENPKKRKRTGGRKRRLDK